MSFDPPVAAPAGYLTGQAMAYTSPADRAVLVSLATPLPVVASPPAASSTALAGVTSVSAVLGPFTPQLGRAIWLTLSGAWTGSAQVQRSTDSGATRQPLTAAGQPYGGYTANANEAVVEESCAGATYYLSVSLTSGALTYRVAQ